MAFLNSRELTLRCLLTAGVFGLLIVCFSPSWGAFQLWARVPELSGMIETRRAASVLAQIEHPGAPVADELHRAIQWRLLFPLVGRVLQLPPPVFFGLAHAGCLLVLGYVISRLRRDGYSWADAALAACSLGAASWFFTATGWLGYFDSWLALGLLLLAFAERREFGWLACVLAPWIDERFVLAAPLALLCRWAAAPEKFDPRRDVGIPTALLSAFVAIRLGVLGSRSAPGATVAGYLSTRDYLSAPLSRIALGIWDGLRSGWIFVAAAVYLLRNQRHQTWWLGGTIAATAVVGLATAQDYSRTMTMLLPAALLGLILAHRAAVAWLRLALRGGAAVALVLPAHHVMNDAVVPIFNLQTALHFVDHPAPLAMAELYELRAIHAMERAEFDRADADLALAIKLARDPTSPARQRGVLAASQGRWSDALTYFSLMAQASPQNPDAWFMCAQARLALADTAGARKEFDHAVSLAPPDWATRPDVARFQAKLRAAVGGK